MIFNKLYIIIKLILLLIMLAVPTLGYTSTKSSILLFSSNNTQEIGIETAYGRLIGPAQHDLRNKTVRFLQKNHFEEGKFRNILGSYQMASNGEVTGDNSEIYYTSPYQAFSNKKIFSLAAKLANLLRQESVAVFIPAVQAPSSDIILKFSSKKLTISKVVNLIHEKLPDYSSAYSLHLSKRHKGFNNATVVAIEWLGGKINVNSIKKAFPKEIVIDHPGYAYLVYKDGSVKSL